MDPVAEIKSRLPIEELVARYVQLQKKGRNFVALCPFHNDSHPSLTVSPDKGIAYCFACQSGGDIFSFYQKIESVDFPQAIKDLAERVGVELPKRSAVGPTVSKDEKQQLRECLAAAHAFFRERLTGSKSAQDYLQKREVSKELIDQFELGVAPDSFSETYEHLLKEGFTRKEILAAGLGIQRELKEERIYDRFRNRLIFPIFDAHGGLIAFGGRTLGDDDAKYINSSESPLYQKGSVLYGLHLAKDAIRESKRVIVVEGYFDLVACHRVGVKNVVATSGTALTEAHGKLLRRYVETVTLCLDQDRAGKEASERAFQILAPLDVHVETVRITGKDPDEAAQAAPEELRRSLTERALPYLDAVLHEVEALDLSSASLRREALKRVLGLFMQVPLSSERELYLSEAARILGTTETALRDDLMTAISGQRLALRKTNIAPFSSSAPASTPVPAANVAAFSKAEIALGMLLLYPQLHNLLSEMIPPSNGLAAELFATVKKRAPESQQSDAMPVTSTSLGISAEFVERAGILQLFCEEHAFADWSQSMAAREIRKNLKAANQEILWVKQAEVKERLVQAHRDGKRAEEAQLETQYQQLLKLTKMATM